VHSLLPRTPAPPLELVNAVGFVRAQDYPARGKA
jgi:hypothetical protein